MSDVNRKGFTLVELVIVMAVIALILGVVIPNLRGMQQEGQLTKAEAELQTLKTAVTAYWRTNGNQFPDNLTTLSKTNPQLVSGPMQDPFITQDGSYASYGYLRDAKNEYFIIWSQGPNKDTAQPRVANGQVYYSGSGKVVSNFPVIRQ